MKKSLIIGQALLLSLIIVFGGFVVINEKLPTINKKRQVDLIMNYYNEKYKDNNDLATTLKYDTKGKNYYLLCYNKNYKNLNFKIIYTKGEIKDSYKDDYILGKNIISVAREKVLAKYKKAFINTNYQNIDVTFKSLDKYKKEDVKNILEGNYYDNSLYLVSYYVKVDNLDDNYLSNLINSFKKISYDMGIFSNNYSVTFDNNGIIKIVKEGDIYE